MYTYSHLYNCNLLLITENVCQACAYAHIRRRWWCHHRLIACFYGIAKSNMSRVKIHFLNCSSYLNKFHCYLNHSSDLRSVLLPVLLGSIHIYGIQIQASINLIFTRDMFLWRDGFVLWLNDCSYSDLLFSSVRCFFPCRLKYLKLAFILASSRKRSKKWTW